MHTFRSPASESGFTVLLDITCGPLRDAGWCSYTSVLPAVNGFELLFASDLAVQLTQCLTSQGSF